MEELIPSPSEKHLMLSHRAKPPDLSEQDVGGVIELAESKKRPREDRDEEDKDQAAYKKPRKSSSCEEEGSEGRM